MAMLKYNVVIDWVDKDGVSTVLTCTVRDKTAEEAFHIAIVKTDPGTGYIRNAHILVF